MVRHRRHERVRGRLDGRRASTRSRTRASMAEDVSGTAASARYFGGFVPWVFDDVRVGSRDRSGDLLAGYRAGATVDVAGDAVVPILAAHSAAPSRTRRPRSGCTRSSARSAGRTMQRAAVDVLRADGSSGTRGPTIFFGRQRSEPAGTSTPFFDQVYRGSAVFDYGVESVTSADGR